MIRLADLQQILSYSSIIEKIQQTQQQHPDTYQQYASFKMRAETAHKQNEVPDSKKSEDVSIKDEKMQQRSRKKDKKKNKQSSQNPENNAKDSKQTIDIVV